MVLLHVGYVLMTGSASEMESPSVCLNAFRNGGIAYIGDQTELVYFGLTLIMCRGVDRPFAGKIRGVD